VGYSFIEINNEIKLDVMNMLSNWSVHNVVCS